MEADNSKGASDSKGPEQEVTFLSIDGPGDIRMDRDISRMILLFLLIHDIQPPLPVDTSTVVFFYSS